MSIESIRQDIASLANTPENALALVEELSKTDWQAIFTSMQSLKEQHLLFLKEYRQKAGLPPMLCSRCNVEVYHISGLILSAWEHDFPGKYCESCVNIVDKEGLEIPVPCARCNQLYPRKDIQSVSGVPGYYSSHCSSCADEVRKSYARHCDLCNADFCAPSIDDKMPICSNCRTKERIREVRRVDVHNQRAIALDLPATITIKQWLDTLAYFDWKCAYCSNDFQLMEHFLPLSLLIAGTTYHNCIPACQTCNTRKLDRHPNTLDGLFPTDNLARIRSYLASVTQQAA